MRRVDRQTLELWWKSAEQEAPGDRNHQNRGGYPVRHPAEKRDVETGKLPQITDRGEIRAGARRRADAADQRTERASDHQRTAEVALPRLEVRVAQDADPERQEQRGDRHVGDPHREERADDQEPQKHAVRPGPNHAQDVQHETRPETGVREAGRQKQDADEESDQRVAEAGADDRRIVGDAEHRNQEEHRERSDRERDRLGDPERDREREDRQARFAVGGERDDVTGTLERGGLRESIDAEHDDDGDNHHPRTAAFRRCRPRSRRTSHRCQPILAARGEGPAGGQEIPERNAGWSSPTVKRGSLGADVCCRHAPRVERDVRRTRGRPGVG